MPETDPPETLPGLEKPAYAPARAGLPDLRAAVRRTISELEATGRIRDVDAGKIATADYLAAVIMTKERTGRASTISNDARLLVELLDALAPDTDAKDAQLADAMAAWSEELA